MQINHWHPIHSQLTLPDTITPTTYQWLADTRSMTQRLRQTQPLNDFTLLWSDQTAAFPDELNYHSPLPGCEYWARYVLFSLDDQPALFSRALIPYQQNDPHIAIVKSLGERPLGELLFTQHSDHRQHIQITQLNANHPLLSAAERYLVPSLDTTLARRSLCFLDEHPVIISDVFLPALIEAIHHHAH